MKHTDRGSVSLRATRVLGCVCAHTGQDKTYGPGMRLHNLTKQSKAKAEQGYRCTVCSRLSTGMFREESDNK